MPFGSPIFCPCSFFSLFKEKLLNVKKSSCGSQNLVVWLGEVECQYERDGRESQRIPSKRDKKSGLSSKKLDSDGSTRLGLLCLILLPLHFFPRLPVNRKELQAKLLPCCTVIFPRPLIKVPSRTDWRWVIALGKSPRLFPSWALITDVYRPSGNQTVSRTSY